MFQQWTIATDLQAGRKLAEDILQHVRVQGYDADVCFAIRLALEEALINAIKHGNHCDPRKKICISAYVGLDKTDITISDEGGGFNPQACPTRRPMRTSKSPAGAASCSCGRTWTTSRSTPKATRCG